ncbi:MAG: hypothetical protein A2Y22_03075 [Clostridiales bacterium GWD2_32_59]|nr:MAG: hypothetical protein A2Y22_03075 [Clostridiales bacterium GWD2_32_59]
METSNYLICPTCTTNTNFMGKYEATYIYSYIIDSNSPGRKNDDFLYPFLYDKRELTNHKQYLECCTCGAKYDLNFNIGNNKGITYNELKDIINSDLAANEIVKS